MEKVGPKLRFKDKNGTVFGGWEEKKFGDIFSIYSTNCLSREYLMDDGGYIRNIHYGDIHTKYSTILNVHEEEIPYIKSDVDLSNVKDESYCKKGDLIIADTSEDYADVGKSIELINVGDEKIVSGLHTFLCRDEKGVFVEKFKGYLMNSPCIHDQIRILASGTKVYSINKYNLIKLILPVPSLPEQQKIAAFLSKVDEKIALQSKKLEELGKLKRGFMQKIFARELRFKDENGKEFGAWEEKRLEELCNISGGGTPSKQNLNYWNGTIPWISSSDIREDNINKVNITRYITQIALENSATKLCPKGTILLVSRVGVGKVAIAPVDLCTSQDFTNLIDVKCNNKYFAYLLSVEMKVKAKFTQGTSIKGITTEEIKATNILTPSLPEQEKIADFLSKFDERIEVEAEILERWKKIKKGLLQQMFV